jgi:peptidoglycan/LPS O-acetylase OafA/YrhL
LIVLAALIDTHDGAFHSGLLDAYDGRRLTPLARCFGGFWLGLLVYRASQSRRLMRLAAMPVLGIVLLGCLLGGLVVGVSDLLLYPLLPLLVLHLVAGRGPVAAALAWTPVWQLGVLSYAIYMLHPMLAPPLQSLSATLGSAAPPFIAAAIAALLVGTVLLMLSWLAYRYIEEPGRRWVRSVLPDQASYLVAARSRSALGGGGPSRS